MVPAESPERLTLWAVTPPVSAKAEETPYVVFVPYWTWVSDRVLVVQVMVAEDWEGVEEMEEMGRGLEF